MLSFVKDVVKKFKLSTTQVQVGLETFEVGVKTEFTLSQHTSIEDVLKAVDTVSYVGGGSTNTGDALEHIRKKSFSTASGTDLSPL